MQPMDSRVDARTAHSLSFQPAQAGAGIQPAEIRSGSHCSHYRGAVLQGEVKSLWDLRRVCICAGNGEDVLRASWFRLDFLQGRIECEGR